jgi:hypothetical protein
VGAPCPVRSAPLRSTSAAWLLAAALVAPLWAGQPPTAPAPREPDVITREPLPVDWRHRNWEIEQLATPVMPAPGAADAPREAVPVPPPHPSGPRSGGPRGPLQLPQLGPDASFEQRVRVPQAGAGASDLCEEVLAGLRRAPAGLDCSAAPLQPATPPPAESAGERPASGRVKSASDAPGVPLPGGDRSGVQVLSPQ